jgi:hypothetical protein
MLNEWKSNDPEWKSMRTSEWKIIQGNLEKVIKNLNKKQIKALERYFLTGKESKNKVLFADKKRVDGIPLIFKLWFHPDRSKDNWEKLATGVTLFDYLESLRILNYHVAFSGSNEIFTSYGLMGGLEQQIFEFLLGNGQKKRNVISPYGEQKELDLYEYKVSLQTMTSRMATWLFAPNSNPYALCQYMLDYWFDELAFVNDGWLSEHSNERNLWKLFIRVFCFVEPSGLSGEDTPQRRFAEKFKKMLDSRELPDFVKRIWLDAQKNEVRTQWLKEISQPGYQDFDFYFVHNKEPLPNVVEKIVSTAYKLGFVEEDFSLENKKRVDFSNSLRPQFKKLLGYSANERVPANSYSMFATSKMTDVKKPILRFELLEICHSPNLKWKRTTPILVWIPRPDKNYLFYQ